MIEFKFDLHPQLSGVRTSVACLNRGVQVTVTGSFSKVCTHGTTHKVVMKHAVLITEKASPKTLTQIEWILRYDCSRVKEKAEAEAEALTLFLIDHYISSTFEDVCLGMKGKS